MYKNCKCKKCYAYNNCKEQFQEDVMEKACSNMPTHNMSPENGCGCGFDEEENVFPNNPMYAQSYVPWQTMDETFTPCVGLKMGTIFPELVSPYAPCQSMAENAYIESMNSIKEGCNQC